MIKLERNEAMERAITKAMQSKLKVHVVCADRRMYRVRSASDKTAEYVVRFVLAPNGLRLGECSCPAGQRDQACKHLMAAFQVNAIVAGMRRAASRQEERAA